MSLNLKEKQQLRSVIELIVQNPLFAKKLFIDIKANQKARSLGTLKHISSLIDHVCNYDFESNKEDYVLSVEKLSSNLNDKDVKNIILSSLGANEERSRRKIIE